MIDLRLWRVTVFERPSHTNPAWERRVMAPSKQAAVICAMTQHQGEIGRIEVENFDGYGIQSDEWMVI